MYINVFSKSILLLGTFRKIAKSDWQLRLVCLSVCPCVISSAWTTRLPMDGFS